MGIKVILSMRRNDEEKQPFLFTDCETTRGSGAEDQNAPVMLHEATVVRRATGRLFFCFVS